MADLLVWMDLEMTGLDPERDVILEIATIITDASLNEVAEGPNIAINHSDTNLLTMDSWSREHHEASGLLERVIASRYKNRDAMKATLAFLSEHCEKQQSPLCGNTIWQDRRFLIKHMPELEQFFHYRNIDISSLKELVRRWYPSLPPYEKDNAHLALGDIRESINELRYYRRHVFLKNIPD